LRLFVDTSVWSLAFRRDAPPDAPEIDCLRHDLALLTADADFRRMTAVCPLSIWPA